MASDIPQLAANPFLAFGRDGVLPRWMAHVHPRWHSPDVAILIYSIIAFLLSLTSTFASLAIMANVAALLLYIIPMRRRLGIDAAGCAHGNQAV